MADDFEVKSQAFQSWFHYRHCNISPKINLADLRFRNAGRGVLATQDILEDEELFSLSRADILTVENSDFSKTEAGKLILADLDDQWTPLILVMIFECLRGQDSPWSAYFGVLPTDFNSLMFWTDDELDQLQASTVRQRVGKQKATDSFLENVLPAVRRNQRALFPKASSATDDDILYLAHRMASTIMSYAFDIEKDPSQQELDEDGYASDEDEAFLPKGMIPMADMLNADAHRNNARLFYERSSITMRAIKPIRAGEEIFNDYGQLPRSDLLRRYGYITPNYVQYDVVEIPRQLIIDAFRAKASEGLTQIADLTALRSTILDLSDEKLEQRLQYLNDHEALDDGYDLSRNPDEELFPASLLALMWTLDLSTADFNSKKDSTPRQASLDWKKKDSVRFLTILGDIVQARLSQYSTSLQDDEQLAAVVEETLLDNRSDFRKAMALHVRIGEKQILVNALLKLNQARDDALRKHAST